MNNNCRTCLNYLKLDESVSVHLKILENLSVLDLIKSWALIEVATADSLPTVICKTCYQTIQYFTDFILIIRRSDIEFRKCLPGNYNDMGRKEKIRDKLEEIEWVRDKLQGKNIEINTVIVSDPDHDKHLCQNKTENDTLFDKVSNVSNDNVLSVNNGPKDKCKQLLTNNERKMSYTLYKCPKCPKSFKRSCQYKMHMTVHNEEKKYLCTICGKYFSRSYVLIYHMRVHTGEKKFNCNICNKSFIHPSNLYKHKKIHTNTRNYKCEHCNKCFVQSETLKNHIRRIHTGEKPFLCEICSKSFSSQSAMWVHKQDAHKEKESCRICHKQFSSRILKRHMERHKDKPKKNICEQCGKSFSSGHNLKQHLLSHNGIKPYASQPMTCPWCQKLYSKRRIKSHICISIKKLSPARNQESIFH